MLLIQQYPDNQVLLPLYQLFSRLIALPSHREALLRWRPPSAYSSNSSAGPSILRLNVAATAPTNTPYILDHLLTTISLSHASPSRRANTKLLEASLDLLAALVKGQSALSTNIRLWTSDLGDVLREDEVDQNDFPLPRFISILVDMLLQSPTPVRIASANWYVLITPKTN